MDGDIPIYIRVQRDLMAMLKADGYEPGSKIPSERELSVQFGASRMTTRKAVEKLVDTGVLERRGTSGTYLPEKLLARPLRQGTPYGITDLAHEHGRTSGSKLLYFEKQPADEITAQRLEIATGDPVILIRRQRTIDDVPVCIELIHMPARVVPGLSAADVVENSSLYELLSERYDIEVRSGNAVLSVGLLTEEEAELLNLPPDSPVLDYQTVSLLQDGKPFELLRSINHPRHVSFHITGDDRTNGLERGNSVKFALVDRK